jgi:hypothetical protein
MGFDLALNLLIPHLQKITFCSLVAKKWDVKSIVAKKKARLPVGVGGLESCLLIVSDYET